VSLSSQANQGLGSSSQAFTAFGAACIDHSTATTGFHANQKAVCTRAASFRGLVGAFHLSQLFLGKPAIIANFKGTGKP
jgi:mevalonate pyrophosphate decarboxylase